MAWLTADDVVAFAGISDPDWDLLDALAERAQAVVESWCRCSFSLQQLNETYDIQPGQDTVVLRHYPVAEVGAVYESRGADVRLLSAEEYTVDQSAGLVRRRGGPFPEGAATVRVVYSAGYSQPPPEVLQAAVMLAADWYRNRPDGRVVREAFDGYEATYAPELLPPRVREMLEPYRRVRLA